MEEYKNPKVCQKCAKCCKQLWLYVDTKDDATRIAWLDTDKIAVEKMREGLWRVTFDFPCKQLIEKNGMYHCKQYDGKERPGYCRAYPANFNEAEDEIIERESKMCPIIKEVLERTIE